MKRFTYLLVIPILILILTTSSFSQLKPLPELRNFQLKKGVITKDHLSPAIMDSIIKGIMAEYYIPGVSSCIIRDGEILWTGSYGYANIELDRPVTDSTLFIIASISKTITATALMQLWENGLFDLDDDINEYLPPPLEIRNPNFPDDAITFRMLLTHTSSINYDWALQQSIMTWGADSPISLESFILNYFMPDGDYYSYGPYNTWAPGTTWEYSNEAITLVGYLVEVISDTPFADYCQENIFTPLGMNETAWFLADLDTTHIAMPYYHDGSSYIPFGQYGMAIPPAGQLRTSVTQLARFAQAYMNMGELDGNRILDSSTVDLMTTVQYPEIFYVQGLVWFIYDYQGNRYAQHTGGVYGCSTILEYVLDEKTGIICFINIAGEVSAQGFSQIVNQLYNFTWLYKKIFAYNVDLDSHYIPHTSGTLTLTTRFENLEGHAFTAQAICTSTDSAVIDSFDLFDDGSHNDGAAGDGIWGNIIGSFAGENEFWISISTTDQDNGEYLVLHDMARFTTIGPVTVEGFSYFGSDTTPNYQDRINLLLNLENKSSEVDLENITTTLSTKDPHIRVYNPNTISFNTIPAGSVVSSAWAYTFEVLDDSSWSAKFDVTVKSNGYAFWRDSIFVDIISGIEKQDQRIPSVFTLDQNYPNPFNPNTTIEFAIPLTEYVSIKVYNLLGQEVTALVSETLKAGFYEVEWNAADLSSGIYIYTIQAGNFRQSRKLVLIK